MSKSDVKKTASKKRGCFGTALRVIFWITAVPALLFLTYTFETVQPVCWKSGEVSIGYTDITLPCRIEEFERLFIVDLHPDPSDPFDSEKVKVARCGSMIELGLDYKGDYITGIGSRSPLVVFPGGISVGSDTKEALRKYNTFPFNIYRHKYTAYWGDRTSEHCRITTEYRYFDYDSYEIWFDTEEGKVTLVNYFLYDVDDIEQKSE